MAFPVRIHRFDEPTGPKFKASTSLQSLSLALFPLDQQLSLVEMTYAIHLSAAIKALEIAKSNKIADARAFWFIGDVLKSFSEQLEDKGFYLVRENATFARDLSISESSIRKIKSFFRRFPDVSQIDPQIPWNKYRNNKIPHTRESSASRRV